MSAPPGSLPESAAAGRPRKVLGPWQAATVVVGMVVGAGIFRSASGVAQMLDSGPMLLLAWAAGGLFALAGAFTYAELATSFPHPGGDYRFLREAFGPGAAFLFAWSRFSVIFTASGALLAFVAADYLAQIVPLNDQGKAGVAALAVVGLTAVNLRGLRFGAGGQAVLVTLDVLALVSLGGAAAWLTAHGTPSLTPMMTAAAKAGAAQPLSADALARFGAAMVFIMLAYGGFNDAATLSAEVKGPRDMTLAMVGGMGLVTLLYLLANWAYLRGLGLAGLAKSDAPAADLMRLAFGPAGQAAMVVFVCTAALAVLNALVIVGGRTLYAAASDEPALARLAEWDEGRGVPRMAIWAQTGMTLLLIGWGAVTGRGFSAMVDFLSPVFWLFLTLTGLALVVLRRTRPDAARPYRVPLFPLTPLVFAAGSAAVLMSSIGYVGLVGCALSFGMLALGLVLRAGLRLAAARRRTA